MVDSAPAHVPMHESTRLWHDIDIKLMNAILH
jgi:hypothetical protein